MKIPVDFLPAQQAFMEDTSPELLYSGAFGAGKTRILCEKAYWLSTYYDDNFGIILRKTFKSLRHTTLRSLLKGTGGAPVIPADTIEKHNKSEQLITLVNGSEIVYGGLDDPDKWGSLEVAWIAIDEAVQITEDDYIMLLGRLRQANIPFRQLFMATNPGSPTHFLYSRFYKAKLPTTSVIESNTLANTYLPVDYKASLNEFKGKYYERYVLGKWTAFEGIIYNNFNPLTHIIDPFIIPPEWSRYRAIDFGYNNPFTCQWWAVSPDNVSYMYREIYMSHRIVEQHAKDILTASKGENIVTTYADHNAEDRATLEHYGVPTVPASKEVSPGIQEVYSKLEIKEDTNNAQIYFFRDTLIERDPYLEMAKKPICVTDEIQGYVWQSDKKEAPRKENDHGLDSMRYFVFSLLNKEKESKVQVSNYYIPDLSHTQTRGQHL